MVTNASEPGWAVECTVTGKMDNAQGSPCTLVRVVGFFLQLCLQGWLLTVFFPSQLVCFLPQMPFGPL